MDFQMMGRRLLGIVDVQASKRAVLKTQADFSRVLHVDLQVAQFRETTPDRLDASHQPRQVIDGMALTLTGRRRPGRGGRHSLYDPVFPRMRGGRVPIPEMDAVGDQSAELARLDELARPQRTGVEAQLEAHQNLRLPNRRTRLLKEVESIGGVRDGLLQRSAHGLVPAGMATSRCTRSESRTTTAVDDAFARPPRGRSPLEGRRVRPREARPAMGPQQNDVGLAQRDEITGDDDARSNPVQR